jgi:transcriptional regulator with XRE-family HTH domain
MSVGKTIRAIRTVKGLTLPQLAVKSGVSKGSLSQIENEETANPSLDTLYKIAGVLGVTLGELLDKQTVKAKRLVPADLAPGLKELFEELKKAGKIPNDDVLQAVYAVQHRTGRAPKTKDDWRYLYETIERWLISK